MAYGIMFQNEKGFSVLNDGEMAFHYWGKITATKNTAEYQQVPLFNIPSNVKIRVYQNTPLGLKIPVYMQLHVNNNVWVANLFRTRDPDTNGSKIEIYVFVEAQYMPIDGWGALIKDASGRVTFNSSRPMLRSVHTRWYVFWDMQNAKDTRRDWFHNRKLAVPANAPNAYWRYRDSVYGWKEWNGGLVSVYDISGTGLREWEMFGRAFRSWQYPLEVTAKETMINPQYFDWIFPDEYERFPNLGNFS